MNKNELPNLRYVVDVNDENEEATVKEISRISDEYFNTIFKSF